MVKRRDFWVYFILDSTLQIVKVGISPNPSHRLGVTLHNRHPYPHYLLGKCKNRITDDGIMLETRIHQDLKQHRVPGTLPQGQAREWFYWNEEVKKYFKNLLKKEDGIFISSKGKEAQ